MERDVFGVRIVPSVVEFFNTKPKTRFELPIIVKNVSQTSKSIRYYGPKSEVCPLFIYSLQAYLPYLD